MLKNDGYALLIGIDDYSTFDQSRGQDIGHSDLLGSRNDVRNFWKLCRLLGMKPENMRVLASPPLSCDELEGAGPENIAPATAAEIVAKVGWLAEKLAAPSRPTGLMTYSGHGDTTPAEGLVLCPSDVGYADEAALDNAVSLRAINAVLERHGAGENLTIVLDTCHSGSAGAAGEREVRIGRPLSLLQRAATDAPVEVINARVLAASARDEVAYQSMFDGAYRGVFSWAVCAAMAQWKVTPEGDGARLDVSYGKLVETTQRLVAALWFDQRPELRGPSGTAELPVFGLAGRGGATHDRPNARFLVQQIDPGQRGYTLYTISQNAVQIGYVLVTNTASGIYAADREYWYLTSNISMGSAVTFTGGSAQDWTTPPGSLGTLSFKTKRDATWSSNTPNAATTLLLATNALTGERIGINWQITVSHGSWGGSITWWHSNTNDIFGPGTTTTLSPGLPAAGTWYSYITAPLP